jgi:hypothetical protein
MGMRATLSDRSPVRRISGSRPRARIAVPARQKGVVVSEAQLEAMGPIDDMVLEWDGEQPVTGEVMPLWENRWAAPVAVALRRSGGQLVRHRQHPRPGHSRLARRDRAHPLTGGTPMPGLLRGVVRTAAVAGTATAVSNRVSRRQGQRWAQQQAPAYDEPEPTYAAPPPAAAAPAADPIQQLKDLADLRQQGILTDEEFAAQKAKILGS